MEKNNNVEAVKAQNNVEITKAQYDELLKQQKELLEEVKRMRRGELPIYEEKNDEKIARMRMVDGKPCVGWAKTMLRKKNAKGEDADYLVLWLGKEKETKEMEYLTFLREAETLNVKILSEKIKTKIEFQGYTTRKYVKDFRTIDTGMKVPVKIEIPEVICECELPDGTVMDISNEFLNV